MGQVFKSLFANPESEFKDMPPFLQQAYELRKKENGEKLVKVAVSLLGMVETSRSQALAALRAIRKQEKQAAENLKKFELAARYFEETGNFGPLSVFLDSHTIRNKCAELGVNLPDESDKVIPEGWTPKETK